MHPFRAFVLALLTASALCAHNEPRVTTNPAAASLRFTENLGQWESSVLARSGLPGGALFVESTCLTFNFYNQEKLRKLHMGGLAKGECSDFFINGHAYKVHFENASPDAQLQKLRQNADYENFYLGNNPGKWKSGVHNYGQLILKNLYPGIDYELLAAGPRVKYNFHVQPGSDPAKISLRYEGVDGLMLSDGKLFIKTSVNEVVENKPYAYQVIGDQVVEVPCNYVLRDGRVTFAFPKKFDRNHALVIDPVLIFSAQIGTTADNFGMTATFDQNGNLYSGGVVYDPGYPHTTGAFSGTFNGPSSYGNTDVFITKYNAAGNSLIFSTYLGGGHTEVVSSLIVDASNNLCLYGATGSADFPVTPNSADPTFNGGSNIGFISNGTIFWTGSDIFVTKFNSNGSALIGSTYFGGSGNDGINYLAHTVVNTQLGQPVNTTGFDSLLTNYGDQYRGEIQLDSLGNIYVCSSTRSQNIPIVNGFDNTLGGKQDAVVIKYNSALTSLLYSSYVGGSNQECGNGIFVTPASEIYLTGGTCSNNFPGTAGSHGPTYKGGVSDGFIARISASGTLMQSTYLGTNGYDNSFFVQCDKFGSVYVYGQSLGNFPVQPFANLPLFTNAGTHQFVAEYNLALTTLQMSTVFGSSKLGIDISPSAFAVDECNGNLYLSGWGGGLLTNTTAIGGMPILNPTQATTTGYDFYLMALKPHASALLYGSYFGGGISKEHVDGGTSRFDRKGIIYQSICAGCGGAQDFPISSGAWPCPGNPGCPHPNLSANCNNGVVKINYDLQQPNANIASTSTTGCAPLTVNFTNVNPGTSFKWYLGAGNTTSTNPSPAVTFTNPGTHFISLVVMDTTLCIKKDSTVISVQVHPKPALALSASSIPCTRSVNVAFTAPTGTVLLDYGDGSGTNTYTPVYTYTADGVYLVTLSVAVSNGCSNVVTQTVSALRFLPEASESMSLCSGSQVQLLAYGGTSYSWSPPVDISGVHIPSPVAFPTVTTVYTVNIANEQFGQYCEETFTIELGVKPSPVSAFSFTRHACDAMVFFSDHSFDDVTGWEWDFGGTGTSTVANASHFFPVTGTHSVVLTVQNVHGCKGRRGEPIFVTTAPVSISGSTNICRGGSAQLEAQGGVQYEWMPEATLSDALIHNPVATPSVSTDYSVIVTTQRSNTVTGLPCEYTLATHVKVSTLTDLAAAEAMASPTVVLKGDQALLVYTGDPGAIVSWLPVGSTSPQVGYSVSAQPSGPMVYTATVVREACSMRIPVSVDVRAATCYPGDIFIPNTFTPNGDGTNDQLRIRGLAVDEMYFTVYNRWGERVFETRDKQLGWDGRYNGKDADVGVFGWYLTVKCFNGEETFRKGNVTLIR